MPVSNRLFGKNNGGNNSQLRQIIKSSSGLKVKGHQVHEILSKMQSQTSKQLIQQSFLVRSLLKKLQEVDKNGTYVLESKESGISIADAPFLELGNSNEDVSSVGFEIERLSDTLKDTLKKDGLDQIDRIYMAFGHFKSFFSHRHQ